MAKNADGSYEVAILMLVADTGIGKTTLIIQTVSVLFVTWPYCIGKFAHNVILRRENTGLAKQVVCTQLRHLHICSRGYPNSQLQTSWLPTNLHDCVNLPTLKSVLYT
ncbi:hypothetical protein FSHL1_000304 [Fusarium sambucinum]